MNFTNSPYEKMMKQKPRPSRPKKQKPPHGSPCRGCTYWQGLACVGTCHRDLIISKREETSGQHGPK